MTPYLSMPGQDLKLPQRRTSDRSPEERPAAVVVFARLPEHEQKGLAGNLAVARQLHTGLLLHTLSLACSTGAAVVLALDGEATRPIQTALSRARDAGCRVHSLRQRGDGFGARFAAALGDTAALGYERLVIVGTDIPELRLCDLERGLASRSMVVGPSRDGGFYLLGLDVGELSLLGAALPWRRATLATTLVERAASIGVSVEHLAVRDDLDTPAAVRAHLGGLARIVLAATGRALEGTARPASLQRRHHEPPPASLDLPETRAPRGPPITAAA